MRVLLVVNPTASSVTARRRADVEAALRAAGPVTTTMTERRGHATTIARNAADEGFDVVAVLAGDGTLNEAADGLVGSETALAALPGGSTNVFARTLQFASDPRRAAAQVAGSLTTERARRIGLGVATWPDGTVRHFLFHLGIGFDAAIIARMERHVRLKRHLAHPTFAMTAIDTWFRHFDRTVAVSFTTEEQQAGGPYAVISNSDPYAFVGRRRLSIAPGASLDRALAVTVFSTLRPSVVTRGAYSAVTSGRYLSSSPWVSQWADVGQVSLHASQPFPCQVDGDYLGQATDLEVSYRPDALRIVVP